MYLDWVNKEIVLEYEITKVKKIMARLMGRANFNQFP
jgi:hypothetical protein